MSAVRQTGPRVKLAIVSGKGQGREFLFDRPHVTIGRAPSSDLVLYDTGVSRGHCEITVENGAFVLRDIGSSNGTFLNESLTTEAYLYAGDRVGVGPVTFEFCTGEVGAAEREQTTEAEPSADTERQKRRFVGSGRTLRLPPTKVLLVVSTVLVFALSVAATRFIVAERSTVDRSGEVFVLNEANAELRFGAGKVDVLTARSATFAFDYQGGKATLQFATGGIDTDDEVSVELNGKRVGYAPASPARWTAGHRLDLPRELLYRGRNLVAFRHHPLAGAVARWGIARVSIEESALPEVNLDRAQQLFTLGKATFDTRSVARPNLARSIDYFEEARLYLEGLDARPPLYYDIAERLAAARDELQETFDSHVFAAEQATRFGERDRALQSLRDLLRYIPDETDARHEEARSRLDALLGAD